MKARIAIAAGVALTAAWHRVKARSAAMNAEREQFDPLSAPPAGVGLRNLLRRLRARRRG